VKDFFCGALLGVCGGGEDKMCFYLFGSGKRERDTQRGEWGGGREGGRERERVGGGGTTERHRDGSGFRV